MDVNIKANISFGNKDIYKDHIATEVHVTQSGDMHLSENNIATSVSQSPLASKYIVFTGDEVMGIPDISNILYRLYLHKYNIKVITDSSIYPITPLINKIKNAALRVEQHHQSYLTYNIVALASAKIPYELICDLNYDKTECATKVVETIQYVIASRRLYKGSNIPEVDIILRSEWSEQQTIAFYNSLLEFFSHHIDKEIHIKWCLV